MKLFVTSSKEVIPTSEAFKLMKIEDNEEIDIVSVSCGGEFVTVLTSDNKIWSLGKNGYGQLSTGDTVDKTQFTLVNPALYSNKKVHSIVPGEYSSAMVTVEPTDITGNKLYTVYTTGWNTYGHCAGNI
jgi:alpha-tubulin suppressor-like RCC1 family protein